MADRSTVVFWLFLLLAYFIGLSVFMTSVNNTVSAYNLNSSTISSSGGSSSVGGLDTTLNCERPRFEYDTYVFDISPNPLINEGLIVDEDTCESFNGFSWITKKKYIIFGETTETCDGALNLSYYTTDNTTATTYNNWHINTPVNELTLINNNSGLCEALGFKWKDGFDDKFSTDNVFSFWGLVTDIVSLRLNFYTGSTYLNGILTLLLIWMPLMLLAFIVYILIR